MADKLTETVELLRQLVEIDIGREGEMASTMVRAGLLKELIDHYQATAALSRPNVDEMLRNIETMLRSAERGEWEEEHWDILERWRNMRGEAAKGPWRWWWKLPEDDLYQTDCDTRDAAIAEAMRQEPSATIIEIIEARSWADDIQVEETRFAETRNPETVDVAALRGSADNG